MRIYIGFDDTDILYSDRGTGKLARWFEKELPPSCRLWGVVRQQLLLDNAIPYTNHNSSACAVVEASNGCSIDDVISKAVDHIKHHFISGSDPGLCVTSEENRALPRLIVFGRTCTTKVVTQNDAFEAASGAHLSGHGGTNDGIIGAAAAVGLTAYGWCGRFIEFGRLRDFPAEVSVSDLAKAGIIVVSVDRDAEAPASEDIVNTGGWLRPRLWGGKPILPVTLNEKNLWESLGKKNGRKKG
jgi:hypothetical protein